MSKLLPFFTDKEVPYTVAERPDTGLYSAKLGIWLFLASEVMLFGGLFAAYIFLRLGAEDGYWPTGLLNVPVGTMNTIILIGSSVTVVFAWASLKMRNLAAYKTYMGITVLCGLLFLVVKLSYEWPAKFHHFGIFIKQSVAQKYEDSLHNNGGKGKRYEISGHLLKAPKGTDYYDLAEKNALHHGHHIDAAEDEYVIQIDAVNAMENREEASKPAFWPRPISDKIIKVKSEDVDSASPFVPRHSTYFATYFLITGLHGLHVLGGILVFVYLLLPFKGGAALYHVNPDHLTNRVEVAGLFWHFVDLVWIFVFPIFYLL